MGRGSAVSPGKGRGLRSSGEAQNDNQPRRRLSEGSAEAPGGVEAAGVDGGGAAPKGGVERAKVGRWRRGSGR